MYKGGIMDIFVVFKFDQDERELEHCSWHIEKIFFNQSDAMAYAKNNKSSTNPEGYIEKHAISNFPDYYVQVKNAGLQFLYHEIHDLLMNSLPEEGNECWQSTASKVELLFNSLKKEKS